MPTSDPIVLYDGDCALCAAAVRFILRHERAPTLRFAALDSTFARAAFARPGAPALPPDTLVVLDRDRWLFRSDAALAIAAHLRAPWRWIRVARPCPRPWRDALYSAVAKRRLRLFGHADSQCRLPDAATAARFIR